jgi:hypothetical protein
MQLAVWAAIRPAQQVHHRVRLLVVREVRQLQVVQLVRAAPVQVLSRRKPATRPDKAMVVALAIGAASIVQVAAVVAVGMVAAVVRPMSALLINRVPVAVVDRHMRTQACARM